jgi:RNA polymerase sigma factor (TIGR02999 family)
LTPASDVTELLLRWSQGDRQALDRLMPLVSAELRRLARGHLRREAPGHTLQPTALVNELYLRMVDRARVSWQCRAQFFAFAAQSMRRILVDHARARRRAKRGGGQPTLQLHDAMGAVAAPGFDVLDLERALTSLAALDERQGRLVELRVFGGLTIAESADVLGVGIATVNRDWASATAWLQRELTRPPGSCRE